MRKTILIFTLILLTTVSASAQTSQQAKKVLDKAAAVVGRKGGANANFSLNNPKTGTVNGTIAIKGSKFHVTTPQAIVWYNGNTQWTYMKQTEEVCITTPTQAQQAAMNPYQFITMYKQGYNISMTNTGSNYLVHLTAQNKQRGVPEMYILINSKTYVPLQVKMKQKDTWTTINISNFQSKDQADNIFVFQSKDYPKAEVVDLR